jgi:hypothetical protein
MPLSPREINNRLIAISGLIEELEPLMVKGPTSEVSARIRFPRGVITPVNTYVGRIPVISDSTLKRNIAYSSQLLNVYLWLLRWTNIGLTAKQMILKHGIALCGCLIEALSYDFIKNRLRIDVNKRFKKNLEKLRDRGIISAEEYADLDRCRRLRDKLHLQNLSMPECQEYDAVDLNFAIHCMNKLNRILRRYHRNHS